MSPDLGPRPELDLDRQLCFALYSASRAVTRSYAPVLEGLGLTYPQYLVMLALWKAGGEPLTVSALGDRLRLDSGTLTPLLKRLEAGGHVHRRRDPDDERRVLVELTPAGAALRDRAVDVPRTMVQRFGMPVARIEALRDELRQLITVLDDAR